MWVQTTFLHACKAGTHISLPCVSLLYPNAKGDLSRCQFLFIVYNLLFQVSLNGLWKTGRDRKVRLLSLPVEQNVSDPKYQSLVFLMPVSALHDLNFLFLSLLFSLWSPYVTSSSWFTLKLQWKLFLISSLLAAAPAWLLSAGEDYTNNNHATSRACNGANWTD